MGVNVQYVISSSIQFPGIVELYPFINDTSQIKKILHIEMSFTSRSLKGFIYKDVKTSLGARMENLTLKMEKVTIEKNVLQFQLNYRRTMSQFYVLLLILSSCTMYALYLART